MCVRICVTHCSSKLSLLQLVSMSSVYYLEGIIFVGRNHNYQACKLPLNLLSATEQHKIDNYSTTSLAGHARLSTSSISDIMHFIRELSNPILSTQSCHWISEA